MRTQLQKWGNSLGLRIPMAFARETGLATGSQVELSIESGRLVIAPIPSWESRLNDLLSSCNVEDLHPETDTGPDVGAEII